MKLSNKIDPTPRSVCSRHDPQLDRLDRFLYISAHLWIASLIFSVVVAETLAIVLFCAWLLTLRRRPRRKTPLDLPILIFLGLRILSIATSVDPLMSLEALRKIPFLLIFFPLSDIAFRHGPRAITNLLRTLLVSAIVVSLFGLARVALTDVYRLASPTSGPTTLAMFLATAFSAGSVLIARGALLPAAHWLPGLAAMLAVIGFTQCRAPWISALIVVTSTVRRRRWIFLLSGIALLVLFLQPHFTSRYEEVFRWPHNLGDRPVIWKSGISLLQERPLVGYGPGTFNLIFDRRAEVKDRRVAAWHNYVLQIWLDSGLFAVLVFLCIIFLAFRQGLALLGAASAKKEQQVVAALLTGLSTLLVAGLFGGLIGDPITDQLFWAIIGLLHVAPSSRLDANEREAGFSRR